MSYTPLDSGLLTSTLLKHGPDAVAVFTLILASSDKLGESSMQPSAAASLLRIDDERAEKAFELLAAPDPKSRNRDFDGCRICKLDNGRWFIVSHSKYQALCSRVAKNERQRRYEKRQQEQERAGQVEATTCAEVGCRGALAAYIAGRPLCSAHAIGNEREPGEEG